MLLSEVWTWLDRSALGSTVRGGIWLYPAIETAHILGLATFFGSIALLDARLLGASRSLLLRLFSGHALPAAYGAFAVLVVTGSLMFVADASELAANTAFQVKLVLIAMAGFNVLLFNFAWFRGPRAEVREERLPVAAKVSAAASLCLWTAVLVMGRLIAYV